MSDLDNPSMSSKEYVCCVCDPSECLGVPLCQIWIIRVWSSKEYVCCVCDPSECLGVPSICQIWIIRVWSSKEYVCCVCVRFACLYEGCDFRV